MTTTPNNDAAAAPPPPPPPLFQEMPTTKKKLITSSTTRSTAKMAATTTNLLFQDQAKPLRIENNSVVVSADRLVVAAAAPGRSSTTTTRVAADTSYAVGNVVRVVVSNLRGYQVSAAGRGRFEENVFVPDPTLKYLLVPIGLQGTVEKVYDDDNNVLSANLPIRVSFVVVTTADNERPPLSPPQPPVDFSMHFAAAELELVTSAAAAVPEEF
jgi:hypothetical protein